MASLLAFFTLIAIASPVSVAADGLSLKVTGPEKVDDVSNLRLTTTLHNTGTSALTFINDPQSMLSTAPTDKFTILHENGANPDFTGVAGLVSHGLAVKEGHITKLNPGQSINLTHSLADAYDFINSGPGTYEISPATLFYVVSEPGNSQPIHANVENSYKVAISGSGRLAIPRKLSVQPPKEGATSATFRSCTRDQQTLIEEAIDVAKCYTNNAYWYLWRDIPGGAPRFTTWFGPVTQASRDVVFDHFRTLRNTPNAFTGWTYDCACSGCDPMYSACVFPGVFGVIHLCRSYWNTQPMRATDTSEWSMGGLLVHEATHFNDIAGTRDYQYRRNNCRNLARNNQFQALRNADSHMFFAENIPALN